MSTQVHLGQVLQHEGREVYVIRIVNSSTLFEESGQSYLLEETYAELKGLDGEPSFMQFSCTRHEFTKDPNVKHKGVDPKVWRRF